MTWIVRGVFVIVLVTIAVICDAEYQEPCTDQLTNCNAFDNSTCSKYVKWAQTNCVKTCGMCKAGCPEGWSFYKADETCVKGFGFDTQTLIVWGVHVGWNIARRRCQRLGGDLVVIKNKDKHTFISDLFGLNNRRFWIGIKDVGQSDFDFQYVDGTKLGSYHPWLPYNPSKGVEVQKCVLEEPIGPWSKEPGKWDNYDCDVFLANVCERKAIEILP